MNTAYQRERRARLRSTGARVLFSAELHPATHEALRTLAKRHGSTIRVAVNGEQKDVQKLVEGLDG